jgi:hypothetical protein
LRKLFITLCLAAAAVALAPPAQANPAIRLWQCTDRDNSLRVSFKHPQYEDVLHLARTLDAHGVTVRCVARSTNESLFGYDLAGVLFRTNEGSFETLFFPTQQDVAELEIREVRRDSRYLYDIFRPLPSPSTVSMDSSRPEYFLKFGNQLLLVWGDQRMATILRATLSSSRP